MKKTKPNIRTIPLKIFKYQTDQEAESQVWVCVQCKKENWEKILLKSWKLIDSDESAKHDCMLCGKQVGAGHFPEVAA